LSGISGVFAGLFALAGAFYVYFSFSENNIDYFDGTRNFMINLILHLVVVAMVVMFLAIVSGAFSPLEKAKRIIFRFGINRPKNY
jgi:cell division protein FtsX